MAQSGQVRVDIQGIEDGDNPRDEDACEDAAKELRGALETIWENGGRVDEIEMVVASALDGVRVG
jgi:hypothetical protein